MPWALLTGIKFNAMNLIGEIGGERGIRTLEALRLTHFPGVLLQPLGHLTKSLSLLLMQRSDIGRK
jgi:hypothetical protein